MYTEETVVDKIEILEDGQMQIRKAIRVLKDGVKISENYHRHVIAPDISSTDLTKEDERVKSVANAVWTKEVKDKFILTKQQNERGIK